MKKPLRFLSKLFLWLLVLALLGTAGAVFFVQRVRPYERAEADGMMKELYEGVQIDVPHRKLDGGKTRAGNAELFAKVEKGEPLTDEESARYRGLYQQILAGAQTRKEWYDREVRGTADDEASVRANLHEIGEVLERLRGLGAVAAPYERTKYAIFAYKDLFDVMAHLATSPNTRGGAYAAPQAKPPTDVEERGEVFLKDIQAAQLERVNSPGYWAAIDRALLAFVDLVVEVQARVDPRLGWFERRMAGPFGGWQSLTPLLAQRSIPRPRR